MESGGGTPGRPVAAVTGGTGFLGRFIVQALADAGYRPRLLVRQDPVHPMFRDLELEVVPGDLNSPEALARLVRGADVVVHAAGLIKAARRADFFQVNEGGSARVAQAVASHAPGARLIMVSSLAAREPHLSDYAASKRAGETAGAAAVGAGGWLVVRPPAIYGPWDKETFALFKAARGPVVPVLGGPGARVAMIHAQDCAAGIAALARSGEPARIYELADANPEGYAWPDLVRAAASAVGGSPVVVRVPAPVLRLVGAAGSLRAALSRQAVMVGTGKVREILHRDWSVRRDRLPPVELWRPSIDLDHGFAQVASWYREAGWLPR